MIEITVAALLRYLVAARMFASTDWTRPHLCSVRFSRRGRALYVESTDGHRAFRVIDTTQPTLDGPDVFVTTTDGNPKMKDEPRKALDALIKQLRDLVKREPLGIVRLDAQTVHTAVNVHLPDGFVMLLAKTPKEFGDSFPPIDRVIPDPPDFETLSGVDGSVFGANPRYMMDAYHAHEIVFPDDPYLAPMISCKGLLDPILLYYTLHGVACSVVTMPKRAEALRDIEERYRAFLKNKRGSRAAVDVQTRVGRILDEYRNAPDCSATEVIDRIRAVYAANV